MARLLAGDVEADDASLAIRHRELGHFERVGAVAHRADDLAERDAMLALRALEPALDALHDLLEVESVFGVENRRVADLGIHDAVAREVFAALVRDTLDRFFRLHDRDRVRETAEVQRERARRRTGMEPSAEFPRVGGGETRVALVASEIDDRRGAEPAVKVVVK